MWYDKDMVKMIIIILLCHVLGNRAAKDLNAGSCCLRAALTDSDNNYQPDLNISYLHLQDTLHPETKLSMLCFNVL